MSSMCLQISDDLKTSKNQVTQQLRRTHGDFDEIFLKISINISQKKKTT